MQLLMRLGAIRAQKEFFFLKKGEVMKTMTHLGMRSKFSSIISKIEIHLRYCIPGYSSLRIETGFFPSSSIQSSKSQWARGLLFSDTVLVSLIRKPQMVSMAFCEQANFASFFDFPEREEK